MVPTRTKFAVGKEQSSNKLKLRVSEQFSKSADCDARLPFHALKTILLFLGNPICHTGIIIGNFIIIYEKNKKCNIFLKIFKIYLRLYCCLTKHNKNVSII